jgi:hypothetical protein
MQFDLLWGDNRRMACIPVAGTGSKAYHAGLTLVLLETILYMVVASISATHLTSLQYQDASGAVQNAAISSKNVSLDPL